MSFYSTKPRRSAGVISQFIYQPDSIGTVTYFFSFVSDQGELLFAFQHPFRL
ncbi:hypothetical protein GYO_1254 [Bacillus spizizenii TU-B-10]|uniref:Uncharacterized protein n=1 Tax=Bacillus spizizenii (strain DSM 15029 / JCM 12233 / NBRC 101239 / NRRL B-23049 / TU-B-10) TaxID=1052585 RepID=G4NUR3_BACS4|nr:hypothetical protein GYO_1254 [Bacillus spizizenii TU-B-10]SCV44464.1 hypothetical protein BQ1740_4115 [Bacillus subtilis]